jgi:hypothetical protein
VGQDPAHFPEAKKAWEKPKESKPTVRILGSPGWTGSGYFLRDFFP